LLYSSEFSFHLFIVQDFWISKDLIPLKRPYSCLYNMDNYDMLEDVIYEKEKK